MYALRPATDADYDFLYNVHCVVMREYIEETWGWNEEWQAAYFRAKFEPHRRQIIRVDGRDAGVLVVEVRPDEVYLGLIELLPEFQRRGIGAAIIGQLIADAGRRGLPLTLHVLKANKPARRLYERLGFRVAGDEAYRYRMVAAPISP
jgi:ribosomal protein S18 acetylase RimI-like enzyme